MSRRHLAGALVLAATSLSAPAWAHGGEDHAAPAAPTAAIAGTERVVSGETSLFSVVLRYPAKKAEGPLKVRVYVAGADTSAPIADAQVRLELKGDTTFAGDAEKTDAAGVYELALPAPPDGAKANGVVSVQARDNFDLVLLGDLRFGPLETAATPATSPHRKLPFWSLIAAAGAFAGLTGALGFAVGRRSRRRPPPPTSRPALSEVIP